MTKWLVPVIIVCGIWAVVAAILVARDLEKRGLSVEFLWLRALIGKYVGQYRKITLEETGRVGPLFYHYVVPLLVALLLVIILLIRGLS